MGFLPFDLQVYMKRKELRQCMWESAIVAILIVPITITWYIAIGYVVEDYNLLLNEEKSKFYLIRKLYRDKEL